MKIRDLVLILSASGMLALSGVIWCWHRPTWHDLRWYRYGSSDVYNFYKRIKELSVQALAKENFFEKKLEIETSIEHFIAVLDFQLSTLD